MRKFHFVVWLTFVVGYGSALRLFQSRAALVSSPRHLWTRQEEFWLDDWERGGNAQPPAVVVHSGLHGSCLPLRGGGEGGIALALIQTAARNPILILLMVASTLLSVYREKLPYAKQLSDVIGICIAAYIFYLLVMWQEMQKDAKDS